ncbi:MAG: FadR family transcriptional regulator [Phycisphaerae bacterium]|nr:FadR family transcriptional regulator [Phycisphaerae bacterium]
MAEAPNKLNTRRQGTRADHVVRQVKNYIFANRLKPGDRLPGEHDLARQLKVSRPTLREAIKGLSVSGLLESRPRSGTRVREFAYEQVVEALVAQFFLSDLSLREVLEARAALELAALPFVLKRVTPEQIAGMREVQSRFETATRSNGDHIELDLRLHEMFLAASGNRLLSNMVGLLRAFFAHPSLEDAIVKRHFDQEEIDRTVHEHRLLIEAAAAHDDALATRVLREHFDRQLRWLEAEEAGDPSETV